MRGWTTEKITIDFGGIIGIVIVLIGFFRRDPWLFALGAVILMSK